MNIDATKPIILTASDLWVDIDAYACILAYRHLLDLLGIESKAVIRGEINESVTRSIRELNLHYEKSFTDNPKDFNYILLDISESKFFAKFVVKENIIKIYDHRAGFERYWQKKLGENSIIELVGSCATLIWEEFKKENLGKKITSDIAKLLAYAVLSNTLDLKSQNTTERDRATLQELLTHAKLSNNWKKDYYNEFETSILDNPRDALINDTKVVRIRDQDVVISQLELWNSKKFITHNKATIHEVLKSYKSQNYFFTSPSISEGKNYIITDSTTTQKMLSEKFGLSFKDDIATTKELILRKEIMKALNEI